MRLEKRSRERARLARRSKCGVASSAGTTTSSSTTTATATSTTSSSVDNLAFLDHSATAMVRLKSRRCVGVCATVRTYSSALGMFALLGSSWLGATVARAPTAVRPWGDSASESSLAGWEGVWEGQGDGGGSAHGLRGGGGGGGRREGVERLDSASLWFEGGGDEGLASRRAGSPTGM